MTFFGSFLLLLALFGTLASIICLVISQAFTKKRKAERAESLMYAATMASYITFAALTICCGILIFCFLTNNTTLDYVVNNQSNATGPFAILYKVSGLWAGREGSLLFWAWLIATFGLIVAHRTSKESKSLDAMALLVVEIVLGMFVAIMVFSADNNPFVATDPQYLDANGNLIGAATMWGMNSLLEHWAMAIHPPTLFIGYAGMTIPVAYAISALINNDPSSAWVNRAQRITLFAWLFLGLGIGLGAIWAYVVLGWGGYWGWDPVENASLLPWLVGLALIHSFTIYKQKGTFKRWCVMCACLAFAFVVYGTFISRSGLVSSVHAFNGDSVSTALFLILTIASVVAGVVGIIIRRKSFAPSSTVTQAESMASKETAYYVNNLLMVLCAFLLGYLTISSALPSPLPFAGQSVSAGTYNAIARPLGIIYCLLMAVCPLLSWVKTDKKAFFARVKKPAICALVLFVLLLGVFIFCLYPNYEASIAAGGSAATAYTDYGPSWYYNGLAIVGLAVASLLFCNSLLLLMDFSRMEHTTKAASKKRLGKLGASISHTAMAVLLVGLIGSSMYVFEKTEYLTYDASTDTVSSDIVVQDYTLVYNSKELIAPEDGSDVVYSITFDVYKGESLIDTVTPSVQVDQSTMQQKLNAAVVSSISDDLFIAFKGVSASDGTLIINACINPLILFVWLGFILLSLGIALACIGKSAKEPNEEPQPSQTKTKTNTDAKTRLATAVATAKPQE